MQLCPVARQWACVCVCGKVEGASDSSWRNSIAAIADNLPEFTSECLWLEFAWNSTGPRFVDCPAAPTELATWQVHQVVKYLTFFTSFSISGQLPALASCPLPHWLHLRTAARLIVLNILWTLPSSHFGTIRSRRTVRSLPFCWCTRKPFCGCHNCNFGHCRLQSAWIYDERRGTTRPVWPTCTHRTALHAINVTEKYSQAHIVCPFPKTIKSNVVYIWIYVNCNIHWSKNTCEDRNSPQDAAKCMDFFYILHFLCNGRKKFCFTFKCMVGLCKLRGSEAVNMVCS